MPTARRRLAALLAAAALAATLTVAVTAVTAAPASAQTPTFDFEGGGWGHGVGMSQWGAKGRADAGQTAAQILAAYYQNTALAAQALGNIRVHLDDAAAETFTTTGPLSWQVNGTGSQSSAAGDTVVLKASGNSIVFQRTGPTPGPEVNLGAGVTVTAALTAGQPVLVSGTGNRYHYGRLVVRISSAGMIQTTIDSLSMQRYLYGLSEVPSSWPSEALKAQAIAARTYAANRLNSPRSANFDIYASTSDQVYAGYDKETSLQADRWVAAVDATDQQVVTYNGAPITAFYFSSSGGATENSEYVFASVLPYARSVPDPFDNSSGNTLFHWKRSYTGAELGAWLRGSGTSDIGDVVKFDFQGPFGASGRIDKSVVRITGTKGTTQLNGFQLMVTINNNTSFSRNLPSTLLFIKPNGSFDVGEFAPGGVRVAGWTYYPYVNTPAEVLVTVDGKAVLNTGANGSRGDVPTVIPGAPSNAGYDTIVPVENATSTVCVNAHLPGNNLMFPLGCRSVTVPTLPTGFVDVVENTGDSFRVAGWTVDPQTRDPLVVHVYVDGAIAGALVAGGTRGDLAPVLGSWGSAHAFDAVMPATEGPHTVCTYAINVGPGANALLGCRAVTVLPPHAARPFGSFDLAASVQGDLNVAGWAIDPDTTSPIPVHVYLDGKIAGGTAADRLRTDVGAAFPNAGPNHGFDARFPASPGPHTVCAYAINDGPPDNTFLGCKSLTVIARDAAPPFGVLDLLQRTGTQLRAAGWAIDPDTNEPIQVHVHIGSTINGTDASQSRPDVDAVFHRGTAHGFDVTLPVPVASTQVCVYAINNNLVGPHTVLGCRTV